MSLGGLFLKFWEEKKTVPTVLKKIISSKIILNFSFEVDSIVLDTDPDPNGTKILDPDSNSMYFDPQHWLSL